MMSIDRQRNSLRSYRWMVALGGPLSLSVRAEAAPDLNNMSIEELAHGFGQSRNVGNGIKSSSRLSHGIRHNCEHTAGGTRWCQNRKKRVRGFAVEVL